MWYNTNVKFCKLCVFVYKRRNTIMGAIEIISGIILIACSVFIVVITLMQSQKQQGMTSAVQGSNNDSFYGKNSQNTREKALERLTKIVAFIFFVAVMAVNIISAVASNG